MGQAPVGSCSVSGDPPWGAWQILERGLEKQALASCVCPGARGSRIGMWLCLLWACTSGALCWAAGLQVGVRETLLGVCLALGETLVKEIHGKQ